MIGWWRMADAVNTPAEEVIALCNSGDLQDSALAVPFDVVFRGRSCRAFAIRFEGQSHAYVNECAHVAMEMDFSPTSFLTAAASGSCARHTVPCTTRPAVLVRAARAEVGWRRLPLPSVTVWCTGILRKTSNRLSFSQ